MLQALQRTEETLGKAQALLGLLQGPVETLDLAALSAALAA